MTGAVLDKKNKKMSLLAEEKFTWALNWTQL
jgi:hypothetical protein